MLVTIAMTAFASMPFPSGFFCRGSFAGICFWSGTTGVIPLWPLDGGAICIL
jgi:hypothetical protein